MKEIIIDVREKDEVLREAVKDAINIPMSIFSYNIDPVLKALEPSKIVFMCRSGARAKGALTEARSCESASKHEMEIYEGGILQWQKEDKEVIKAKKGGLPIMRQVQIIAGCLIILGVALHFLVNPNFIWLSGFVGAGLTFAGLSGKCMMADMLAFMPWNKSGCGQSCSIS